ncbi:DUF3859 domain-containing protein [Yoonia sp.]|uniref:DUF3859 domain-containing protein n=1 Tax=Yoonia sp. TaxID=2212373 RepID=UPI003F6D2FA6
MKHALVLTVAFCIAQQAAALPTQFSDDIASLQAGVICPPPTVGNAPAPGTIAGTTHIIANDPPFLSASRRVPAVLGIGFGIKALAADNVGIEDVTVVVTHPPMGDGQVVTQQFITRISGVSPSITFYQFDHDFELIQGMWTMVGVAKNRVLYSVTFEVTAPGDIPELAGICGTQDVLS